MEKSALKCSSCEDLLSYADKLAALGRVVSQLAWHENDKQPSKEEELGYIISDYASAIEKILRDLYQPIESIFQNGDASFLSELKKIKNDIQDGFMGLEGNLFLIGPAIKRIDNFLNDDLKQIIDLRSEFEKTAKSIYKQLKEVPGKKEASAKHDGKAEAQSADLKRSESQSKIA